MPDKSNKANVSAILFIGAVIIAIAIAVVLLQRPTGIQKPAVSNTVQHANGGNNTTHINQNVNQQAQTQGYYIPSTFFGITVSTSHNQQSTRLEGLNGPWSTIAGSFGKINGAEWTYIEPNSMNYNWAGIDNVIAQAQGNGVHQFMYTFLQVPAWAESNVLSCQEKFGYNGFCIAPPNASALDSFVANVATRYNNVIQYYELWNEPNGVNGYWSGNTQQLIEDNANESAIIHSINPDDIVLAPATSFYSIAPGMSNPDDNWLGNYLQMGGSSFINGISFHYYPTMGSNSEDCEILMDCMGEPLILRLQVIQTADSQYGGNLPIYDTESTWTSQFGNNGVIPDQQEEAYVSRLYIIQASYGVKEVIYFEDSSNNAGVSFSQLTANGLTALAQTYKWLVGSTIYPCSALSVSIWSCNIINATGSSQMIVWDRNSTASYLPSNSFTEYQTWNGTSYAISGNINLDIRPILLFTPAMGSTTTSTSTTSSSSSTSTSTSINTTSASTTSATTSSVTTISLHSTTVSSISTSSSTTIAQNSTVRSGVPTNTEKNDEEAIIGVVVAIIAIIILIRFARGNNKKRPAPPRTPGQDQIENAIATTKKYNKTVGAD